MDKIIIRNENESEFRLVDEITRKAFWNQYIPGCDEHYLVHIMRAHPDFIPELDFVMEMNEVIIGNIMYTKAKLIETNETSVKGKKDSVKTKDILTFGPLTIHPDYQRKGHGKKLMEHSFSKAKELGYDTVVIFGNPSNYVSSGFVSCKKHHVSLEGDVFPTAMMVKELIPGALDGRKWIYHQSPVLEIDPKEAEKFDAGFEKMEKKYQTSQEEFFINSHSIITMDSIGILPDDLFRNGRS